MMKPSRNIDRLLEIMAGSVILETGCPGMWSRVQSIMPYTLEETYEVLDVIERSNDMDDLREELGDLVVASGVPFAHGRRTGQLCIWRCCRSHHAQDDDQATSACFRDAEARNAGMAKGLRIASRLRVSS